MDFSELHFLGNLLEAAIQNEMSMKWTFEAEKNVLKQLKLE